MMTGELRRDITETLDRLLTDEFGEQGWAYRGSMRRIVDGLIRSGLIPDTTTTEEWAIVRNGILRGGPHPTCRWNETTTLWEAAERWYPGAQVVRRLRTTYADRVTEWEQAADERETWARCTKTFLGRCNDGRMRPWWGTDGHNGRERFYTCDRCGVTS